VKQNVSPIPYASKWAQQEKDKERESPILFNSSGLEKMAFLELNKV
jgi:hypothetical protein